MNRLDFGLLVSYSKVEHRMILTESVVKYYNSHCARLRSVTWNKTRSEFDCGNIGAIPPREEA